MKKTQTALVAMVLLVLPSLLPAFLPTGHYFLTRRALLRFAGSSSFSPEDERLLVQGSIDPDLTESGWWSSKRRPYDQRYHFDNAANYADVCSNYTSLYDRVEALLSRDDNDPWQFGRILHAVQDFYSHSNYILLYRKYQTDRSEMKEQAPTIEEVWTHADQYSGFLKLLISDLRTGVFPNSQELNPKPTDHGNPVDPRSLGMNKDSLFRDFNYEADKTAEQATYWFLKLYLRDPQRVAVWRSIRNVCAVESEPLPSEIAAAARKQALSGPQEQRIGAIRTLAGDSSQESVQLLVEVLQHGRSIVLRAEAALAMKHKSEPHAISALKVAAASDSSSVVRRFAVEALASSRSKFAFDSLSELTSSPFAIAVRLSAIKALDNVYSPEVTLLLNKLLNDAAGQVRAEALDTLASQGTATRTDVFVGMLHDSDPAVIASAAKAIGEFKLRSAGPVVAGLLRTSPSEQVRRESAAALGKIGGLTFTADLTTVARARSETIPVRLTAIGSLALIGDLEAAKSLIELLKDPEPIIRVAAADSCVRLRSYDASPIIRKLLWNETGKARSELIEISGLWPEEFKGSLQEIVSEPGDLNQREVALDDLNTLPASEKLSVDKNLRVFLKQRQPLPLQYGAARFLLQRRSKESIEVVSHLKTAAPANHKLQQLLREAIEHQVEVPFVTQIDFDKARQVIEDIGLTIGDVREIQDASAARTVFLQSPPALGTVPLGSALTLYVSLGPAPPPPEGIKVANLVGQDENDARRHLRDASLNAIVNREGRCESGQIVVYQLPQPGDYVRKGGKVYLSLGDSKKIQVPGVIGLSAAQVNAESESSHFFFTFINSSNGGSRIYKQAPEPGSMQFCGGNIDVWY